MNKHNENGFTLLELALVLLISGIIFSSGAHFLKLYTIAARHDKTVEHAKLSQDALKEYFGLEGVYPCPADPTLLPTDANYGLSQCRSAVDLNNNPDDCTGTPGSLSCTTILSRDADNNGFNDVVMMGAVPFRTLAERVVDTPYNESIKIDGYKTLFSYAVTEEMTNRNKYNLISPASRRVGALRVLDENDLSLTVPEDSAHFVLFSHGENAKGGYSARGDQTAETCTIPNGVNPPIIPAPGPSAAGTQVEIENCDNNDAIFVQGIRSLSDNDNYNDDILFYQASGAIPLWRQSLASNNNETKIYNTNAGPVGVGLQNPQSRLHVMGDLSAEIGTLSDQYCDGATGPCLLPSAIGGAGSLCTDPKKAAYAIHENQIVCRSVDWVTPGKTCADITVLGVPTASFLSGFSNLGNIFCCTEDGDCEEQ